MKNQAKIKKIIHTALADYLAPNELASAINLWEKKYSQLSQLRLNAFISEIITLGEISNNRQKIYRHITKQLLESNDSEKEMNGEANTRNKKISLNKTFVLFARCMLEEIRSDQQAIAISHVQTLLRSKGIAEKDIETISNSLHTGSGTNFVIKTKYLRQAINQIYIVLCELIGPVRADRILNKSVSNTSQTEENIDKLI